MTTKLIRNIFITGVLTFSSISCKDLNREPIHDVTSATVYNDFNNYKPMLAKVYAGYANNNQGGPSDILGLDDNFGNYVRGYWKLQELPTDEAVVAWADGNLPDLNELDWTPSNEFINGMFARMYFVIGQASEFIRNTTDDKLSERGFTEAQVAEIKRFRTEARLLRALSYWHLLDMFGNVPFTTDEDPVGIYNPKQIQRAELFKFVESELLAVEPELGEPRFEYARADKATAWTILAKLYLNAEVYTGTKKYADALPYINKVIGAGYALAPDYQDNFLADNHTSPEIIFPIAFHGEFNQNFGGTSFLVHAAVDNDEQDVASFGINNGWQGIRTTQQFVSKFDENTQDQRAAFFIGTHTLEVHDLFNFRNGYGIEKYRNVTKSGKPVSRATAGDYVDIDFPMFRLADIYLMYAEVVARNEGGDKTTAVKYINDLRKRAYGAAAPETINESELTLDFILDERARELHWEGHRRTDLIRFGKFTGGDYIWAWKGGVKEGRAVEEWRALYPIPSLERVANPNLVQNKGY